MGKYYIISNDAKIISSVIDNIPDYCTELRGWLKATDALIGAGKVEVDKKVTNMNFSRLIEREKLPSSVDIHSFYGIYDKKRQLSVRENDKHLLKIYISGGMIGHIIAETERTDGIGRCVGETMHIELGSNSQLGAYGAGNLIIVWLKFNEHYGDAVAFEKLERDIEAIGMKKFFK